MNSGNTNKYVIDKSVINNWLRTLAHKQKHEMRRGARFSFSPTTICRIAVAFSPKENSIQTSHTISSKHL